MPSHRPERVAEAIREVVATSILFDLADPRVKGVTVLRVEVSPDLRNATVFVALLGSDAEQKLALRGIQHASGFLQSRVAARLQMRFTPTLAFKRDDSLRRTMEITRLIEEAVASDRKPGDDPPDPDDADRDEPDEDEDEDDVEDEGEDDAPADRPGES